MRGLKRAKRGMQYCSWTLLGHRQLSFWSIKSTIKAKGKQYDHLNLSVGTGEAHSLGGVYAKRTITTDLAHLTPRAPLV